MSIRVEEYVREDGLNPFRAWFDRLGSQAAARTWLNVGIEVRSVDVA